MERNHNRCPCDMEAFIKIGGNEKCSLMQIRKKGIREINNFFGHFERVVERFLDRIKEEDNPIGRCVCLYSPILFVECFLKEGLLCWICQKM